MSEQRTKFSTISVIGLGYIGLPTAALFASRKCTVIGVDVNPKIVDTINRGEIHFIEPELDIVVHAAVSEGGLRATCIPEPADVFLIAVPTPFKNEHEPDLSYIHAAAQSIAPVLKAGNLVVLESTSPVGATEQLSQWLAEACPHLTFPHTQGEVSDIRIAYCPERVLPGRVMHELVSNDRIIGGMTPACSKAAIDLYKIFVEGECLTTNTRTAEMCKLTENSFRDVNIAFANELSMICDKLDINVWELIQLANRHPRVNILQPGPGVGGHCIAVDPWFIVSSAPEEARLISCARGVNDDKPEWVLTKIREAVSVILSNDSAKTERDVTVACFGLAFKADIDYLRESPALYIVERLARSYPSTVWVVEPYTDKIPNIGNVELVDMSFAMAHADILVLLVDHALFKTQCLFINQRQRLIDCRGIWSTNNKRVL
jgi:UDP-N-acetyl-D-mannosaminuronic acid dehydrogenase